MEGLGNCSAGEGSAAAGRGPGLGSPELTEKPGTIIYNPSTGPE